MKLLLDECIPQEFRHSISDHQVETVGYAGFKGLKNGALLRRAAAAGFNAIITTDRHIPRQQNSTTIPLSIICIRSVSNDLDDLLPFVSELLRALDQLQPCTIVEITPA